MSIAIYKMLLQERYQKKYRLQDFLDLDNTVRENILTHKQNDNKKLEL
ncbi:hypothetical protein [Patiriisocius hiemis]|uniref:Uncharacterized protein n=1 Tax=Patiriisocius hiemis TaxID=3075604 RepID=A0ABU2YFN9_9FLAO|nr:hypothetical protein [Constantimarinum sp. W242]MDT0556691.1 hypothetical protein [Constantimarinum sp. W242]